VSQTGALYNLQLLDSQIDSIQMRLTDIHNQLGQNAAVQAAQDALTEAENSRNEWHLRQKGLENDRERLQQDADDSEKRLYSGQVFNPRELTDLQDKLVELTHRRESLEDPILEAMLAIEEADQNIQSLRASLDQTTNEQANTFGALLKEKDALVKQLEGLGGDVVLQRAQVEAQHLTLYDRLRNKSGGVAVTRLEGNGCGVCGVELTTQLVQRVRHDDIIPCPTCGRILCP
jgi:uncharacterized protein